MTTATKRPSIPTDKVTPNTTLFEFLITAYRKMVSDGKEDLQLYRANAYTYVYWRDRFEELVHKSHGSKRYTVFVKMSEEDSPEFMKTDECWWEIATFDHIEDAYGRAITILEEIPEAEIAFGYEQTWVHAPGRHTQKRNYDS